MNVEHSERVDESTEILKELIKRQQAGLVTNEQAAEVDSACTNARLGHLFRADGSALYGTDLIAPNHFVTSFTQRYFMQLSAENQLGKAEKLAESGGQEVTPLIKGADALVKQKVGDGCK
ncbi:hypothetical protein OESDEN_16526 [Oesophagostomum dentatum]|uniref:Uncharacterized protein n=1 Tax=Oesophagostomum dentatum TaxID=61180 RepID=A0A0B1SIQ9_OESDE|nr:hypothetical protein OESDEN_16526 [Oesophagostomum dentatum]